MAEPAQAGRGPGPEEVRTGPSASDGDLRERFKRLLFRTLVAAGVPVVARRLVRQRGVVLCYHNVLPDGAPRTRGERSLHIPRRQFAEQLDLLGHTHEIVGLQELVTGVRPEADRPAAAITFDDAYRGAVTVGVRELARRGLPATIFVAPGLLGGQPFWWDELADPGTGRMDPEVRERALSEFQGRPEEIRSWARRNGRPLQDLPDVQRSANVGELRAAAEEPGISIGSHTWSHLDLRGLDREERAFELSETLRWLREEFPDSRFPWLAYPFGLADEETRRQARSLHPGAVTLEAGLVEPSNPLSEGSWPEVPRTAVSPAVGLARFELQGAGLFPIR